MGGQQQTKMKPEVCAWLLCDLECRSRGATARPSAPTGTGPRWRRAGPLPTACSMVRGLLPLPLTDSLWELFPYPAQGRPRIVRPLLSLPEALFGGAALVNVRLCFLLFTNLALVWKLREISHFLRPSSVWVCSRNEEFRLSWNKEQGYNRCNVLPCWKAHSCTVMRESRFCLPTIMCLRRRDSPCSPY